MSQPSRRESDESEVVDHDLPVKGSAVGRAVGRAAILIALAGGLFWVALRYAERAGDALPTAAVGAP